MRCRLSISLLPALAAAALVSLSASRRLLQRNILPPGGILMQAYYRFFGKDGNADSYKKFPHMTFQVCMLFKKIIV